MAQEEGTPATGRPSGSPRLRPLPETGLDIDPELDLPGRVENELTPLDEELLNSLIESVDYGKRARQEGSPRDFTLASPEEVVESFRTIWDRLADEMDLDFGSGSALEEFRDLVVYDIPDGTRSTLTVPPMMDVDLDAGMYGLALIHTLKSLGARSAVVMTHTVYNRSRGPEDTKRLLRVVARAVEPVAQYARRHRIALDILGLSPGYELEDLLKATLPTLGDFAFRAHFLVDYAEELFLTPEGRAALERLPNIDVCVRHTKLQVSGGWIPTRMLKSSYVYSQNGTLFSNWEPDEYAALAAVALLSKKLMSGEILSKAYIDIDDVKRRYQLRELNLFQKTVKLRPEPRKLFVVGSPIGLYQVYY